MISNPPLHRPEPSLISLQLHQVRHARSPLLRPLVHLIPQSVGDPESDFCSHFPLVALTAVPCRQYPRVTLLVVDGVLVHILDVDGALEEPAHKGAHNPPPITSHSLPLIVLVREQSQHHQNHINFNLQIRTLAEYDIISDGNALHFYADCLRRFAVVQPWQFQDFEQVFLKDGVPD